MNNVKLRLLAAPVDPHVRAAFALDWLKARHFHFVPEPIRHRVARNLDRVSDGVALRGNSGSSI